MRIIGGTARGHRLDAPKGLRVRPTLDRVRESLFNILAPRIPGARFLDLYAGSGANGIEALSRGAAEATFVDKDEASLRAIRANLQATRLGPKARVVKLSLPAGLDRIAGDPPYDIVFADPPYEAADHKGLLHNLRSANLLAPHGVIIIEHALRVEPPEEAAGFRCSRRNRYGDTGLTFFLDESDPL